ncbi:MAG TPA: hypothetical protein VFO26_05960, partial [Gaiella sp.]|nr:hypothetical protein [Gaiella sp.]
MLVLPGSGEGVPPESLEGGVTGGSLTGGVAVSTGGAEPDWPGALSGGDPLEETGPVGGGVGLAAGGVGAGLGLGAGFGFGSCALGFFGFVGLG